MDVLNQMKAASYWINTAGAGGAVMDKCSRNGALTRRRFLALGGLGTAAGLLLPRTLSLRAAAQTAGVPIGGGHIIRPRDDWGQDLPPTGEMTPEAPEDVRFLLVHHSASPNDYTSEQSIRYLRSFYHYHTSSEKGWPDIAYNFLVDRHGQIFEGRQGSIESPVRGDATGGSQGFALLACFIGDHRDVAPTEAAQASMVALLAWLAGEYDIDPSPGSTVEFISRGSNLHPEGKEVVTPTITGHRTMSRTTCPGDRAFALVENSFPQQVTAALSSTGTDSRPPATASTTSLATTTTVPAEVQTQPAGTTVTTIEIPPDITSATVPPSTRPASAPIEPDDPPAATSTVPATEPLAETAAQAPVPVDPDVDPPSSRSSQFLEKVLAGLGALALGGALWLRRRLDPSTRRPPEP